MRLRDLKQIISGVLRLSLNAMRQFRYEDACIRAFEKDSMARSRGKSRNCFQATYYPIELKIKTLN